MIKKFSLCVFLIGVLWPQWSAASSFEDSLYNRLSEENVWQDAHLFTLGRSKDFNVILYDLQLDANGNLNQNEPIKGYWIKLAEDGHAEELTYIQKSMAYGLVFEYVNPTNAQFSFVSYPQRKLILQKGRDGKFYVHMKSTDQSDVILTRIFVTIDGGTFWIPNVTLVSIYGIKTDNLTKFEEHIIPN